MMMMIMMIMLLNLLQEQWNGTWEAAVAATKVIQVAAGTLAQAMSMTHPQITLANKMAALLPSTQLKHCYIALVIMIKTWPLNHRSNNLNGIGKILDELSLQPSKDRHRTYKLMYTCLLDSFIILCGIIQTHIVPCPFRASH